MDKGQGFPRLNLAPEQGAWRAGWLTPFRTLGRAEDIGLPVTLSPV